jgi:hypothetical protein
VAVLFPGLYRFFALLLGAEQLLGLLKRLGGPLSRGLQLLEVIQLFDAHDGSASREAAAAHERTFLALPDDQLALFALVTLQAGRLGGRFRRQNVALLIQLEGCFAVRIVTAS